MGLSGMVLSAIAAVAGAIMRWAVTYHGTGFNVSTIGLILLIAGIAGFVVSAVIFAVSRKPVSTHRTMDRQVVDPAGHQSLVHEEVR